MSKIYLKGFKMPLTVQESIAKKISDYLDEGKDLSKMFKLEDGSRARFSDINSIIISDPEEKNAVISEQIKERNDNHYSKVNDEYTRDIKTMCMMNPEEKSKKTKFFEMVVAGCGGNITNEVRAVLVSDQFDYFKANPKHPFAKLDLRKYISTEDVRQPRHNLAVATVTLYERVLMEAFETARTNKFI